MNTDDIQRISVIGAGTMGRGIAQVFATAGYEVLLRDIDEEVLQQARSRMASSLKKAHEDNRMDEEPDRVLNRIVGTTDITDVKDVRFAIEAVIEREELKKEVFRELDDQLPDDAIIVSNTSSISITELASEVDHPDQVAGMHFFNPVPAMKLVEVVKAVQSSDETIDTVVQMAEDLGKAPVCVKDFPGFVANRILCPMINEAIYALMEGVAGREEIDEIMKLGMGHPMGPLELADMVGLDVLLDVLEVLHEDLGEDKYRPCPLLRKKVEAGYLGQKSGQGFYSYDA